MGLLPAFWRFDCPFHSPWGLPVKGPSLTHILPKLSRQSTFCSSLNINVYCPFFSGEGSNQSGKSEERTPAAMNRAVAVHPEAQKYMYFAWSNSTCTSPDLTVHVLRLIQHKHQRPKYLSSSSCKSDRVSQFSKGLGRWDEFNAWFWLNVSFTQRMRWTELMRQVFFNFM